MSIFKKFFNSKSNKNRDLISKNDYKEEQMSDSKDSNLDVSYESNENISSIEENPQLIVKETMSEKLELEFPFKSYFNAAFSVGSDVNPSLDKIILFPLYNIETDGYKVKAVRFQWMYESPEIPNEIFVTFIPSEDRILPYKCLDLDTIYFLDYRIFNPILECFLPKIIKYYDNVEKFYFGDDIKCFRGVFDSIYNNNKSELDALFGFIYKNFNLDFWMSNVMNLNSFESILLEKIKNYSFLNWFFLGFSLGDILNFEWIKSHEPESELINKSDDPQILYYQESLIQAFEYSKKYITDMQLPLLDSLEKKLTPKIFNYIKKNNTFEDICNYFAIYSLEKYSIIKYVNDYLDSNNIVTNDEMTGWTMEEITEYFFRKLNGIYDIKAIQIITFFYMIYNKNYDFLSNYYLKCQEEVLRYYSQFIENSKYQKFRESVLIEQYEQEEQSQSSVNKNDAEILASEKNEDVYYSIEDIDFMTGTEFEYFISILFESMNFKTEITNSTGDQGVDVIARKGINEIGIQCKCYSGSVGNSAIQEVFSGLNYYHLNKGMVITNNYFTKSAIELAKSNNIILWDRNILKEKIENSKIIREYKSNL